MKYPWVALSLIIIWLATTYIILKTDGLDVNYILLTALAGTVVIALIGLRPPKIKR
jgi:hypothetical protein